MDRQTDRMKLILIFFAYFTESTPWTSHSIIPACLPASNSIYISLLFWIKFVIVDQCITKICSLSLTQLRHYLYARF
jgi:hypothetical protein